MWIQLSDLVENTVGNGEIACYEQFLSSHNVYKSCLLLMRQNEYLWSKGLHVVTTMSLSLQSGSTKNQYIQWELNMGLLVMLS